MSMVVSPNKGDLPNYDIYNDDVSDVNDIPIGDDLANTEGVSESTILT